MTELADFLGSHLTDQGLKRILDKTEQRHPRKTKAKKAAKKGTLHKIDRIYASEDQNYKAVLRFLRELVCGRSAALSETRKFITSQTSQQIIITAIVTLVTKELGMDPILATAFVVTFLRRLLKDGKNWLCKEGVI